MDASAFPVDRPLSGLRVLIVDDDADTLEIEELVLEDAGAAVVCVPSVAAAFQALSNATVSVVISDLDIR